MLVADWLHDDVFTIEKCLSSEEWARLIDFAEELGFEDSLVSTPQGTVRRTDVRDNQRVMFADSRLAQRFWQRAKCITPFGKRANINSESL